MSNQQDYRDRAADISASALRVYEYWIGEKQPPEVAYDLASNYAGDYEGAKKRHGVKGRGRGR